ncbi:MAG: polysaccharide pyruvyl transferase family protein, partial [Armatimonadota bacterium]
MRIVAEQGGHEFLNMGDLAMLQVALKRLREIWPKSEFSVFTSQPERLKRYHPEARPLSIYGRHMYHGRG